MGEEDKKSKEAEKPAAHDEEKKPVESAKVEQQQQQEIILKVYMHCEGCAKKVRRCLKGFEGVEEVKTDYRTSKVVVKGEKADPLKVLERIKNKYCSHRQVLELISPVIPNKPQEKELEVIIIKSEEKKEEQAPDHHVITVVLGVYMHCEACAQEIKKRIQRMKGVESAEADLKKSEVTVRGVFEPEALVEYVRKRTGKHAAVVATEAEKEEGAGKGTELGGEQAKKPEEAGEKDHREAKKAGENKGNGGGGGEPAAAEVGIWELEMKKSESYYHYSAENHELDPQRMVPAAEWGAYEYPPHMFSDENPNACTVM